MTDYEGKRTYLSTEAIAALAAAIKSGQATEEDLATMIAGAFTAADAAAIGAAVAAGLEPSMLLNAKLLWRGLGVTYSTLAPMSEITPTLGELNGGAAGTVKATWSIEMADNVNVCQWFNGSLVLRPAGPVLYEPEVMAPTITGGNTVSVVRGLTEDFELVFDTDAGVEKVYEQGGYLGVFVDAVIWDGIEIPDTGEVTFDVQPSEPE
jgi:hypothetical protein